jgi:hypothetical protein
MARQIINIGTTANDGTGDPLRTAFDKINDNFVELYGADNNLNTLDANLDVNNYAITTGITNGHITITPNGTGNINLGSITINGSTISSNDSTQITVAENIQTTGTLNVSGAATLGTSLTLASGATVTAVLDEDGMASNSATALATQQSIKAYVDAQVTAQDLDFACDDSTTLSIDLDSESLQFSGGNGITTAGSANTVTIAIDTGTVVTLNDTQTLTNKTLTAPIITSPTLTGPITIDNLSLDDNIISTSSNADLNLNPGGTGSIQLQANTEVTGTLTTDDITTDGNQTITGNLTTGGTLTVQGTVIADTFTTNSNGDITIDPAGTGTIILTGTVTHAGTQTTTGELNVDNININANTISSTNTNGGINITPDGTGVITLGGNYVAVTNELAANDVAVGSELLLGTGAKIVAVTTNQDLNLLTNGTGTVNVNTTRITNVVDPTGNQDAATKAYVDAQIGGSNTLTVADDSSTTVAIDLDNTLSVVGATGISTAVSGSTLTITGPNLTSYLQNTGTQTIDNLSFNDNIISTSSNADLNLNPGGTGQVVANSALKINKGYIEAINALTSSSTITVDFSTASVHTVTLTSNAQFVVTNLPTGGTGTIIITQDGGGSNTGSFGTDGSTAVKFAGGTPTLSTAGGAIDVVTIFNDGVNYLGNIAKAYA